MATASDYEAAFSGRLKGVLQWPQFERLWRRLRANPQGWYVRNFAGRHVPESPMKPEAFEVFLDETEKFLRKRHREDYCGFIYLDDLENPTFIKVFDPRNMGSACGCGGEVKPRWTISRMPPVLAEDGAGGDDAGQEAQEGQGGGLLSRLLSRLGAA